MKEKVSKERILILGASGFLGHAIYRELCGYFKTFGTYFSSSRVFEKNKQFTHYNHAEDDLVEILEIVKPSVIISALRGDFNTQVIAHQHLTDYVFSHDCKILFLSSANVFDAYSKFPSYEHDKTYSNSIYGHFKIKIENMLMRLPKSKWAILRLPMVFGAGSPRIEEILTQVKNKEAVEVFPNLVMNVTSYDKLAQQVHYIINRKKCGIYHLGSNDLVHHDDFVQELLQTLEIENPQFKQVFTTNDERYLAVLPKDNKLPKHLQISSHQVLSELKV